MIFDQATISRVQQATDIVEIVAEHLNLTKKGREMVGVCPFHEDHRPSLYVNPTKQIFKCFACGAGGDAFKFLQMRENLTFPQAVERLAQRAGINIKPTKTSEKKQVPEIDPNKLAKINVWANKFFQKNLNDKQNGKFVRDYLKKRQISDDSIKKWQIGLSSASGDELVSAAGKLGFSTELLSKAGLAAGTTHNPTDKFVNRLMFPITDVTGRLIGFGGRSFDDKGAKYLNSPTTILFDKSNCLYGLQLARHQIVSSQQAVIVEGYTDCIMAHQFGCSNVVATLGTSFTDGHARILKRYAKKVVLIFDNDTAGTAAANRALEVCLTQRIDIKIAAIPQGKDPCDFLLSKGKEQFDKLADNATDVFEFKWNRLLENFEKDDSLSGQRAAIEEFLQTIATAIQSGNLPAIDRGIIVNRLSTIMGLDKKQINNELTRKFRRTQRNAAYKVENQKVMSISLGDGLFAAAQREILEVLLNEPIFFKNVKDKITAESFDVPILRQIADVLFNTLNSNPKAKLTRILTKVESIELSSTIVSLAQAGKEKANYSVRLEDGLEVFEKQQQEKNKDKIKAVQDQDRFLKYLSETSGKHNPRSLGMR